jgi:hypothetical protein
MGGKTPLKWMVYYHNINADRIETINVFRHGGFTTDVLSRLKKCETKEAFAEELRNSLSYYFRCKCEWEVLIYPWCGSRENKPIKIDVYDQVQNNWDVFVDYVWGYKGVRKISVD